MDEAVVQRKCTETIIIKYDNIIQLVQGNLPTSVTHYKINSGSKINAFVLSSLPVITSILTFVSKLGEVWMIVHNVNHMTPASRHLRTTIGLTLKREDGTKENYKLQKSPTVIPCVEEAVDVHDIETKR